MQCTLTPSPLHASTTAPVSLSIIPPSNVLKPLNPLLTPTSKTSLWQCLVNPKVLSHVCLLKISLFSVLSSQDSPSLKRQTTCFTQSWQICECSFPFVCYLCDDVVLAIYSLNPVACNHKPLFVLTQRSENQPRGFQGRLGLALGSGQFRSASPKSFWGPY